MQGSQLLFTLIVSASVTIIVLTSAYYYYFYSIILYSILSLEIFNHDFFLLSIKFLSHSLFNLACFSVILLLIVQISRFSFQIVDLILLSETKFFKKKLHLIILKNHLFSLLCFGIIILIVKSCFGGLFEEVAWSLYICWNLGFLSSVKTDKDNTLIYNDLNGLNGLNDWNEENASPIALKENMINANKRRGSKISKRIEYREGCLGNVLNRKEAEFSLKEEISNYSSECEETVLKKEDKKCSSIKGVTKKLSNDYYLEENTLSSNKINIKDYILIKSLFNTFALFVTYLVFRWFLFKYI